MNKEFSIPAVNCPECKNELSVRVNAGFKGIKELILTCRSCSYKIDFLEKTGEAVTYSKEKVKKIAKILSENLVELRETLPKNTEELKEAIQNPRHPFTAALLAGLVILAMELSGFGIYLVIPWIIGNLILNPLGWILIPIIVAIVVHYYNRLKGDKFNELKEALKDLEEKKLKSEISEEEYKKQRDELLAKHFN